MHSELIYETGLDKNLANYVPLSPIGFVERSARVYPNRISLVSGSRSYTWSETYKRCKQLASALVKSGIKRGDTVSVLSPNNTAIYESHFGVPMTGAVLNTINTRLDANTIAFILNHAETRVLFADSEYSSIVKQALDKVNSDILVVNISNDAVQHDSIVDILDYEAYISQGDIDFSWHQPLDEFDAIALNYTSGTTGNPKGVVLHHRGAYLNAISNALNWKLKPHPTYLWILPMFHCNGWCFPWTVAMLAGTNVCLRRVEASAIFDAIEEHDVTHFCGAPIVLNMIVNADDAERRTFDHTVEVMTAASPPPPSVLESIENQGFHVTHVYGLTETYGPAVVCEWHQQWDDLDSESRAKLKARQGVPYSALTGLEVMNPDTMLPQPADGKSIGEVMFRGNNVMTGYLKNPKATDEAFASGWFHSGDLGVMHSDGYLQLKDRSKDIIISGGENISSIEIEDVLFRHPSVLEAAVVAKSDEKWGEVPCAFVTLKPQNSPPPNESDLIDYCRDNMAHFKAPKHIVFGELPKTSTGKIQKFILRQHAANI